MNGETICAISTPAGVGGIAVVRVSGTDAFDVVNRIWKGKNLLQCLSHTAHLGTVCDAEGKMLDQAVATVFHAPHSFTGENVVEVAVHGSKFVQQALIESLCAAGARIAEPGEFTRRAFSAGKMDLAQAEAVADIIASESRAAHRIAMNQMRGNFSNRLAALRDQLLQLTSLLELELDFSEEDVEFASRTELLRIANEVKTEVDKLAGSFRAGKAIKDGIPVAIVGATNAGKSSLLNALLEDDRAIVSDIHGTTRDVIEDTLTIGDYMFRIMDTAGLRHTDDTIENLGIERSRKAALSADIIIYVVDSSSPAEIDIPATDAAIIRVYNKIDKSPATDAAPAASANAAASSAANADVSSSPSNAGVSSASANASDSEVVLRVSAKTGEGIDALKSAMQQLAADAESASSSVMVTNTRHLEALIQASQSITRAIEALQQNLSGDLISPDIRLTIQHLSSILGDIPSAEILANIFSRFCIGK